MPETTLDETYEPRPWQCEECRYVLGVVMRDTSRVRRLFVFFKAVVESDVPSKCDLFNRPRGMFIMHGTDWAQGVECPLCGARTEWALSTEIRERLRGENIIK
jgi:hypothetical protein